jgi:hypothetical protein
MIGDLGQQDSGIILEFWNWEIGKFWINFPEKELFKRFCPLNFPISKFRNS